MVVVNGFNWLDVVKNQLRMTLPMTAQWYLFEYISAINVTIYLLFVFAQCSRNARESGGKHSDISKHVGIESVDEMIAVSLK